jgi:hypothetical protein
MRVPQPGQVASPSSENVSNVSHSRYRLVIIDPPRYRTPVRFLRDGSTTRLYRPVADLDLNFLLDPTKSDSNEAR